jgi:predicted component of type VI protein secretion system
MGSVYLKCRRMTTRLDKTLKRELTLEGRTFILAVSPEGLKLTLKGKRKGQELRWGDLVSGDAALAAALNASLGTFAADAAPAPAQPRPSARAPSTRARRARKG